MLSDQKIKKRQRSRAIKGLEAIHKHGILHNDIREENVLINDNGDVYLIDFGMASREDTKKKRKLFEEEQLKYSNLLDRYNACIQIAKKILNEEPMIEYRPPFLNGLELDAFFQKYRIGLEVQGAQHRLHSTSWYKDVKKLEDIVNRDRRKRCICQDNRISLLEVWYDEKPEIVIPKRVQKIKEFVCLVSKISAESSKRQYLVDYEEEQNRNVKRIRKYPSPSSFAHINYLYDHEFIIYRPSSCVGTPLILYNSAFSQFKEDFNNEKLPMSKEHNQWTLNCIKTMSDFYSDEKLRQKEFHEIIRELFSKDVKVIQLDDNSSNDGILELDFHTYSVLFLLIEIKNEIGTGRCDPTTQAAASYAKFYTQIKYQKILKGCNLPCFIIGLAGPWICILGAVYVEKPLIEPLTSFEPLIFTNDRIHLDKIARLFRALRLGGDNLKTYYNSLPPSVVTDVDPQRFFPYPRNCKDVGGFIYKEKLVNDPHKLLWKAETKEDGREIVIKFTHRYNGYAHKLCHDIGKAPNLLYVSSSLCGLYMIVMEYVNGQKLRDCDLEDTERKKIINDIEVAINHLHTNDIVFADLRDSNILVIKDDDEKYSGMLVDFDWAGRDNVDCYPTFMNADIDWPTGAEDTMKLKEHDIYWLNLLKKKYLNDEVLI
ncbi:16945_t:CDS:2 [Funneliformis geosporum]|nr:16945_t:CDS:2 [Funneliformis geosporum]